MYRVVVIIVHLRSNRWAYGVVLSMFDFHRSDRAVKFNVYNYTMVRHPWQVSENNKPRVHPSHVKQIG